MMRRISAIVLFGILTASSFAKDKSKHTLPIYVLQARTVAVIIDPKAGFPSTTRGPTKQPARMSNPRC